MLFKKEYGELVQDALSFLETNTDITNTSIGGVTRSLIEIINKNIAEYYDVLDINMAMSFLSTAEGYFLDLIGQMFNMQRLVSAKAELGAADNTQRFYVTAGTLHDRIPTDIIPANTYVRTSDGVITFYVSENTAFSVGDTEVYVPIIAEDKGTKYNVGKNTLIVTDLGVDGVYTTNNKAIASGTDTEADSNYRYRLSNATLAAEKANEIAVRLAALSVPGVSDVVIKPYARGIGSYDLIVIPVEGIANSALVGNVQNAIDSAHALGVKGTAISPTIVPVNLDIKLMFLSNTTDFEKTNIRGNVRTAVEKYIVNIPLGGEFILNELRQQIMDVDTKIKDHVVSCYYFREQPHFLGNVEIYWDEMFYPNPDSPEAIRIL